MLLRSAPVQDEAKWWWRRETMQNNHTYVTGVCGDLHLAREVVADLERAGFRAQDVRVVDIAAERRSILSRTPVYGRTQGELMGRSMLLGAFLGIIVAFVLYGFLPPGPQGNTTAWAIGIVCVAVGATLGALQGWLTNRRSGPSDTNRIGGHPSSSAVGAKLQEERPMDEQRHFEIMVRCRPEQVALAMDTLKHSACHTVFSGEGFASPEATVDRGGTWDR
jgi:hypothetical protein